MSNTLVLERVNYAISLLENQRQYDFHSQSDTNSYGFSNTPYQPTPIAVQNSANDPNEAISSDSDFTDHGFGRLAISEVAAERLACESILSWACFEDMPHVQEIKSFPFQSRNAFGSIDNAETLDVDLQASTPLISYQGINEADMPRLCHKFSTIVLLRNPIMDAEVFQSYVTRVIRHGLDWDGPTTIVVSPFPPSAPSFCLPPLLAICIST